MFFRKYDWLLFKLCLEVLVYSHASLYVSDKGHDLLPTGHWFDAHCEHSLILAVSFHWTIWSSRKCCCALKLTTDLPLELRQQKKKKVDFPLSISGKFNKHFTLGILLSVAKQHFVELQAAIFIYTMYEQQQSFPSLI